MKEFKNINDILDFAMQQEQRAVEFYTQLASVSKNAEIKKTFEDFAKEEVAHKARLSKIKEEQILIISDEKVADLKISDYMDSVKPSPDMDYRDALVLAMNREKSAMMLYSNLANMTTDAKQKDLFNLLALQESKHKLFFELEYDNYVLKDN